MIPWLLGGAVFIVVGVMVTLALCWAAAPVPEPPGVRNTIGTLALPPNIKRTFAACRTSCSIVRVTKSINWISPTGRIPVRAAPTQAPAIPASEIGVSITRCSPNSANNPALTPNAPP